MVYRYIYGEELEVPLVRVVECLDILRIFEQQVGSRTTQTHNTRLLGIVRDDRYPLTIALYRHDRLPLQCGGVDNLVAGGPVQSEHVTTVTVTFVENVHAVAQHPGDALRLLSSGQES